MKSILDSMISWHRSLKEAINELSTLAKTTEGCYSKTDQDIQAIIDVNSQNTQQAEIASSMLQSGKGLDLKSFRGLYEEVSTSVNRTLSEMITNLENLVNQIGQILDLKSTLEEVIYSIRNVSLLMKIKSSKLIQTEFDHVVVGLEGLSMQIKDNTEGINLSANEALYSINQLIDEIKSRLEGFRRVYSRSQSEISLLFDSMDGIFRELKTKSTNVQHFSDSIDTALKELVSSLSYQDRPFQQIGQVIESLNEMSYRLSEDQEQDDNWGPKVMDLSKLVRQQKDFLEDILKASNDGAEKLQKRFESISETTAEQLTEARLISDHVADINQKMKLIDEEFEAVSSTLSLSEEKTADLLEAISNINKNIMEVSKQVSLIDVTRNDLEALTYNAVFKAAKVGAKGRVMGTITDEITSLSREVHAKISDKEGVINSIVTSSKQFKSTVSDRLNNQLEVIRDTSEKSRIETGKFLANCQKVGELTELSAKLNELVNQFLNRIRVSESVIDRFGRLSVQFQTILDEISLVQSEDQEELTV